MTNGLEPEKPRAEEQPPVRPATPRTGFDVFFGDILIGTKKLAALPVAGGIVSLPLFAGLAGFAPPWPPGLVVLTSMMEVVVMVVAYQLLANAKEWLASTAITLSAVAVLAFSALYVYMAATFIYQIPNNDTRVVMGCGLSEKALIILEADKQKRTDVCPGDFSDLLSSSQYNTERVWAPSSVSRIKSLLVFAWLGAFGSLAALFCVFVSYQRRQPPTPPGGAVVTPAPRRRKRASSETAETSGKAQRTGQ